MVLELNQLEYNSGEVIKGAIHLNIERKYPAKVVYLEIKGVERTKWKSTDG